MKLTINFAVVGCGLISRFHFQAINAIEDARLCGVYDIVTASAQKAAHELGVRQYTSYEELLDDPAVDALCICTPSHLHGPLARQAILAGKHVLVEKPLALRLEQSDEMIALARANKVEVGVVSQLRFSPSVHQVKRAIETGVLGRLTRGDLYMKYFRSQAYYDSGKWRGTIEKDGGGALMNQGIHGVDLLRYLMGPVKSIYALSGTLVRDIEVEDTLSATVAFQSGAIGVIEASTADYPGTPRRMELNGEYGRIVLEEDRIIHWDVEGQSGFHSYEQKAGSSASHRQADALDPIGHIEQLKNFISAVRGDTDLLVDAVEGRRALELILAAYESVRTGFPVNLPFLPKPEAE